MAGSNLGQVEENRDEDEPDAADKDEGLVEAGQTEGLGYWRTQSQVGQGTR